MPDSAEDCPFCAIVKAYPHPYTPSSTPEADTDPLAHIILSTPDVIAFLDALPLTKCHTLLIPRQHHELISSTPADIAAELGRALPLVCRAAVNVAAADAFNVVQNNGINAGQVVPHAHFHIIPRYREFSSASKGTREELDDVEGREIARKMREVIDRESKEEEEEKQGKAKL